jgi:hypothetical protein
MEKKSNMSGTMGKGSQAMQSTAETVGDTIVTVIDRLAGKKSDLKLTFDNLTLDAAGFNAKVNGSVILDVTMAADTKSSSM